MSRIAVLLSSYNGEKYIQEQIESIVAQDTKHIVEIIVRDDGSTDSTHFILDEYQKKGILKWYAGENLKSAYSFLDLLSTCGQYDYYSFCDQDDYWMPDKLDSGIEKLQEIHRPAAYFCNAQLVDANLNTLGRTVYKKYPCLDLCTMMCAANALGCTMILNDQLVSILRKHDFPYVVTMHDSFIVRTCLAVGGKVIYDHGNHMLYRQHGNNVIGISSGIARTIKSRIYSVVNKSTITIDEQAAEIIRLYSDVIPYENMMWLQQVVEYRKSLKNRMKLAFSRKTHYISFNMGLQIRLSILLGKR